MKEATGELNMTVITIVAIAAIAAFFYIFVWPGLQKSIAKNQCRAEWGAPKEAVITVEGDSDCFVCTLDGYPTQSIGESCN